MSRSDLTTQVVISETDMGCKRPSHLIHIQHIEIENTIHIPRQVKIGRRKWGCMLETLRIDPNHLYSVCSLGRFVVANGEGEIYGY